MVSNRLLPTRGSPADITARLERLPLAGPVMRQVAVLALGCFFENYFLQMTAYVAPGMVASGVYAKKAAGFWDTHSVGFFIMAGFAGMMVGSSLFGFVADRFGRRPIFAWAMVWYSLTTAMMGACSDGALMSGLRFLSSIGLGLELIVVNTYVSELVSSRVRGRAVAYYQIIALSAVPLSAFAAWWLTPISPLGLAGWRWVMWLGSVAITLVWWFRRRLGESPRWLAARGRWQEADAATTRIEAAVVASGRELEVPLLVEERAIAHCQPDDGYRALFRAPYARRTVMFLIQQTFMPVAFYGFASWVPTLLIAKGIAVTESLFYAFLIAFAQPISPMVQSLFADRIDRKWQIALGGIGSALLIWGFAVQTIPALVVVFGIGVTFCKTMITTAIAGYMPECYPTVLRGRGHGLVYGISRLMAALSGLLVAWILARQGVAGVAALIGVSFTVVALITLVLGPKVRGRTLEEINP